MSAKKTTQPNANALYYGDNLGILREHIKDESVDLIYLDPPFNSARDYNVLFASSKGEQSEAQIVAFKDSWHWGEQAERECFEIVRGENTTVAVMMEALRQLLGENDMMAYLVMMTNRLLELRRVLKPTGSLYLHCDPTASHYLKIVLDAVFGKENYRNEIIWKRKTGRGETNNKAIRFGVSHDVILLYAASKDTTLTRQYRPSNPAYITTAFTHTDADGRRYHLDNIASPSYRPNLIYEYKGYQPPANGWAVSRERMEQMEAEGRLYFPADKSHRIRRKRFLDELEGETVDDLWDDVAPIHSQAQERL
ncbi:MAG: site-specific DNA-methyltransferase, partial [Zoogloeaceae bacterium]|nr:site-specific DNA-methyltransferase [Zoogloeaceae bacterium]